MLQIYDPRTNVLTPTNYDELEKMTGRTRQSLSKAKSEKSRIKSLDGYLTDHKTTLKDRQTWYAREVYKKEVWLTVEGSDGTYQISNHGRFKRVYKNKTTFVMPYQIKNSKSPNVKIRFQGSRKEYEVSRLVAHHFIGERPAGMLVRRKNGILTDNHAGNLEYITREKLGQLTGAKSRSREIVQLDAKTLKLINEFRSAVDAGKENYLSSKTVLMNCHGEIKVSAGVWKFMFADEYEELIS